MVIMAGLYKWGVEMHYGLFYKTLPFFYRRHKTLQEKKTLDFIYNITYHCCYVLCLYTIS
jgi:hypothetical protein